MTPNMNGKAPKPEIHTFTPQEAESILARSRGKNFRAKRDKHVGRLARMMESDQWEVNGSCIVFDPSGLCVDGQHRLHACVQAGKPFSSLVLRGVTSTNHLDVDSLPREESDYAAAMGLKRTVSIVAALRLLAPWQFGLRSASAFRDWSAYNLNHGIFIDLIAAHGQPMQAIKERVTETGIVSIPHTMFIGRVVELGGGDVGKFTDMVTSVNTGTNLKPNTSPANLHSRLTQNRAQRLKMKREDVLAITIRAWNSHANDEVQRVLKAGDSKNLPEIAMGL